MVRHHPGVQLPLTSSSVDPGAHHRSDRAWLTRRWAEPRSRVAVFDKDRVAVEHALDGLPSPLWVPATEIPEPMTGDWVFLGIGDGDIAHFAIAFEEGVIDRADQGGSLGAADQAGPLRTAHQWSSLRELGVSSPERPDLAVLVAAVALLNWHRRHPRCPLCGQQTELTNGGWLRRCPKDQSQHFPRVDPAVIMLVVDPDDRALLGRQARWPQSGFSTLAGFVEPGETLENAVAREVLEEVGLVITSVTYRASQPWPFPSSLMLGFRASAEAAEPVPDGDEIAEARWFTRAELVTACTRDEVRLPPGLSISRWLIEQWFGEQLPGDWSRA